MFAVTKYFAVQHNIGRPNDKGSVKQDRIDRYLPEEYPQYIGH